MPLHEITIRTFGNATHRQQVVELWQTVFGYSASYNAPEFVIDRKTDHDDLFFVALDGDAVVGTVMAGYDGHRGWIYSLAVHPDQRKQGIGSMLLDHAQRALAKLGCFKVNLQILKTNEAVRKFYEANGFAVEDRLSMGKRLD
ncbi:MULTISPECIES: GNAT family acetyltransferase [unclassified Pseudodesulfovibrio]|uniref:GNAT family acetyltransferase n=1 Tax=unclassified Pseudodesulfovibrio TaxID=2661612 RepID=UPI000FEC0702|nr:MULTISPECIES: GNAT family acetyltransferase [unclassified Pseudodesulfovibrio]MCJ2165838.1 GNAT family acetyltransferase [Pseudodesulfovibrio sp. S3-i]RWU02726.1 GNAT family acetyltransferase [Pseudodesulfovibrio sp. S3]